MVKRANDSRKGRGRKRKEETTTVFRFSFARCTFAVRKTPFRLVSLSLSFPLPPPLSPPYRLSLPIYISLSFSRLFSTIFGLLRLGLTRDLIFTIFACIISRERSTQRRDFFGTTSQRRAERERKVRRWRARAGLFFICEELIQPASQAAGAREREKERDEHRPRSLAFEEE